MNTRQAVVSRAIEDHVWRTDVHYRALYAEYAAWHKQGDWGRAVCPNLPCSHVTGHRGLVYIHIDTARSASLQPDLKRLAAAASNDGHVPILRRGTLTIIDFKMAQQLTDAGLRLSLPGDVRELVRWHNYKWAGATVGVCASITGAVGSVMLAPAVTIAMLAVFIALTCSTYHSEPRIPGGW